MSEAKLLQVLNGEAGEVGEVFILQALENVRVEVYIDGQTFTNRRLKAGDIRAYKYGNYHRIIVHDSSKVLLQDGDVFVGRPEPGGEVMSLLDWTAGNMPSALEKWRQTLAESTGQEIP